MIGIVIVAHGGLAIEYKAALEYVVGPQAGVVAVTIRLIVTEKINVMKSVRRLIQWIWGVALSL